MNEFPGQDGKIVSQSRVHASFVARAVGDFKPEATFSIEFMVSNMNRVIDADGVEVEPTRLALNVVLPQYTPESASVMNVDYVPLIATSQNVINAVEGYWTVGSCYKASGRLNFSSRTEEILEEVDFGEAQKKVRTTNVSEFIITGGSQSPLEGDFAWEVDDIKAAMAARKTKLEDKKNSAGAKKTPAPANTTSKGAMDLGF